MDILIITIFVYLILSLYVIIYFGICTCQKESCYGNVLESIE